MLSIDQLTNEYTSNEQDLVGNVKCSNGCHHFCLNGHQISTSFRFKQKYFKLRSLIFWYGDIQSKVSSYDDKLWLNQLTDE
jgi:hypothetical protein